MYLLCVMIAIKGYTEVTYKEMQKELNRYFRDSKRTLINTADALELKTPSSVQNALNVTRQEVSDMLLSKFMTLLNFPCLIIYDNGARKFFVHYSAVKKSKSTN